MIRSSFGQMLVNFRDKHNLTQLQLADLLDVPNSSISKYETIGVTPHPERKRRIVNFINSKQSSKTIKKLRQCQVNKYKHLFSNLKYVRCSKGLTQTKLSNLTGLRQSRICKIETGRCTPTKEELNVLAKALEVPVQSLTRSVSKEKPNHWLITTYTDFVDKITSWLKV